MAQHLKLGTALLLAAMFGPIPAWAQQLRALVVGVDAYAHERPLLGAVNDARTIAQAVRGWARETILLTDEQVVHNAILVAWQRLLDASASGDTILVAFSGHGGREWVGVSTAHPRGFREFWVMPDFDRTNQQGRQQDVQGTEIEAMVAAAHARDIRTLLVADHCYSGAVYRQAGVDTASIRSIPMLIAEGVPLVAPPVESETAASPPPPGLTSLGADRADTPVSEFRITGNGEVHGALSYAVAMALTQARRAIDPAGDGAIRRGPFLNTVNRLVNQISDGQQEPQLRPPWPVDDVLFRMPATLALPTPPAPTLVPLRIDGVPSAEAAALATPIRDAMLVLGSAPARLVWQPRAARLLTGTNMTIATAATPQQVGAAVARTRALDALLVYAARGQLQVEPRLGADGPVPAVFFEGERLEIAVSGLSGPNLVVFNVSFDGKVQPLYPIAGDRPLTWPRRGPLSIRRVGIVGPFGEDQVVAVAAQRSLGALNTSVRALAAGGRSKPEAVRQAVIAAMEADPSATLAIGTVFTAPASLRCDPEVIRNAMMLAACPTVPVTFLRPP